MGELIFEGMISGTEFVNRKLLCYSCTRILNPFMSRNDVH